MIKRNESKRQPVKDRIVGKTAAFIRRLDAQPALLLNDSGVCTFCGSAPIELHSVECPMFILEGVRMDLNCLFYGVRSAAERAKHPEAF